MAAQSVCLITGIDFLFPALISAIRIANQIDVDKTQIVVLMVDVPAELGDAAAAEVVGSPITLASIGSESWTWISSAPRTPRSIFGPARFFLEPLLSEQTREIVMINGNAFVAGDIRPLLSFRPPAGQLLAAENALSFARRDGGRFAEGLREYFTALELSVDDGYFDVGVLSVERKTWREISAEAVLFLRENDRLCRHYDTSALNAVARTRRLRMSAKFNFQTAFVTWGLEKRIAPALHHFSQAHDPWTGRAPPWEAQFDVYNLPEYAALRHTLKIGAMSPEALRARKLQALREAMALYGPRMSRLFRRRAAFAATESVAILG